MTKLFEPLKVGTITTGHRVAMAPLTRFRNDDTNTPTDMVKEYYKQRSAVPGTLIVSEATFISLRARSDRNAPGIYSDAQIAAWKHVVDAVHANGSKIFLQLWHMGRLGDPEVLAENGFELVSSTATPLDAKSPTPVALTEEDIATTIEEYGIAAKNAIAAGFDGVEIHGANGYLADQFLQDVSGKRTDRWGGSIENRARFHLEVTKAVVAAVGADRTALRLSPYSTYGGMLLDDPNPTFRYLLEQLKPLGLAYLHLVEARISGNVEQECKDGHTIQWMVELWNNASPILVAGGFTPELAFHTVDEALGKYDVIVVFGRSFIPNPDLVFRLKSGIPLEKYDRSLFYNRKEARGYIDYPYSQQFLRASA
ncbi:hypothetical protein S7711_01743 [Stachybotrys chartarum IBT 7711]|uniref:NADH:flavin oxidoreductase/NADH oxidase N-terminal domain-containing protein n=1 Tax=Stachybotrys chartarum (strain CBS 109288 / IBT 7711) TaxID=1280523 RepID=A0A084AVG3_STACB|nr:hypothetical protein S7711_01743 [Stachybotrys chartarum IBT 7711]